VSVIRAADLFCGAGGSSTGLRRVADALGARLDLTAVNHWPTAVETHAANHPEARHVCENLDGIDARKVTGGQLDLLWASPECTHHSTARGGKPVHDQSRSTAWHVLRWAEATRPRWVIVENVPEFQTWGPLGAHGRPLASRKGETFQAWAMALRSLGYTLDYRVCNAADFGAATSRRRLFVVARLDGGARNRGPIPWPLQTHAPAGTGSLFGEHAQWRGAREVIDWRERGTSIFGRQKPLADNTLRRIAAGARKFWGLELEPFLVAMEHGGRVCDAAKPLPTITTAKGGAFGIAQPFLVQAGGPTGAARHPQDVDAPLRTVLTENHTAVVQPFLLGQQSQAAARGVSQPAPTVSTAGAISLIEPFIVSYYGTLNVSRAGDPLPTVTTKDRFGLVQPSQLDITFRMLRPHELAAAMGFPAAYQFAGNRTDQVKQIGNAVEVNQAAALWQGPVESVLGASRRVA
jgi:DNA (cytosine-5)-methyltransferase 1